MPHSPKLRPGLVRSALVAALIAAVHAAVAAEPPASEGADDDARRMQAAREAAIASAPQISDDQSEANYRAYLAKCRADYEASDARIAAAGRADAEYYRVPGFPYLRTDRLLASFRLEAAANRALRDDWMLQMRENDSIARDIELANLGLDKTQRAAALNDLRTCAVWLSDAETDDAATLARLVAAAQVPAPAAGPGSAAAEAERNAVSARFAAAAARPPAPARVLWAAGNAAQAATRPVDFSQALHDALGRVGLVISQWPALAERLAPPLLLEDARAVPGVPVLGAEGPRLDRREPTLYYLPGYARVGSRMLVQMVYFAFFENAAGRLESLVWRVTLDDQAQPLLYESLRGDGREHLWFPRADLRTQASANPPLVPQTAPETPFAIALDRPAHAVQGLVPLSAAALPMARRLRLRPYEDLMTLPRPGGGTRSLFDAQGLVADARTAAEARVRLWGRHPLAPGAERAIDDPHLLEQAFVVPTAMATARAPEVGAAAAP